MLSITIGGETPTNCKKREEINIPNYVRLTKDLCMQYPDNFRIKIPENARNAAVTWDDSVNEEKFNILDVSEVRGKLKVTVASWGPEIKLYVSFN
jgi:hypothetical protein